eukprot:jgi/Chrzof1/1159/Cz01g42220.t1
MQTSGVGVRASMASSRYSNEDVPYESGLDDEDDEHHYQGSEGETDTLQHTRSSFADEGDTQYTQSDNGVSRSLDATGHTLGESMADDHSLHQSGVDSSRDFTPEPAAHHAKLQQQAQSSPDKRIRRSEEKPVTRQPKDSQHSSNSSKAGSPSTKLPEAKRSVSTSPQKRPSGKTHRRVGSRSSTASPPAAADDHDNGSVYSSLDAPPSKHVANKRPSVKQRPPVFEGDLSEWGKTQLDDFFDDDQSMSSHPTLSSGVSPRDAQARVKPFDLDMARETLAYNAGMYSRAQAMRRDGTAPAAMGIADDLPTRMAYQQLHVLAGMAGKVQDAILHNKRIFEQRMKYEDRNLMKKVFEAWKLVRYGSVAKQAKLKKAVARIMRGALSRAFFAWKDELHLVDKNLAMKRKVAATIARGLLKRSFLEWRRLAEERWWKNQYVMREREIQLLEAKIRGYERRPIQVIRKRKLSAILGQWFVLAEDRRSRRMRIQKAANYFVNQQYIKAWNAWVDFSATVKRRKVLAQKTVLRIKNLKLAHAWNTWAEVIEQKRELQSKLAKAAGFWQNTVMMKAWNTWREYTTWRKDKKNIMLRWQQPQKARAFTAWVDRVQWSKRMRVILNRTMQKMRNRQMSAAFDAWVQLCEDNHLDKKLTSKEDMQAHIHELQAENERLRRDNERFVRLIDSGEWGRGRVAELVTAGEVLKGERDALLKLIQSLRREYEAVQMAKTNQEDELKQLKERMTVGGPARNRMLVKGGSSFNALVRAMKQDLIENGTAAKDPALLYEIDKVCCGEAAVILSSHNSRCVLVVWMFAACTLPGSVHVPTLSFGLVPKHFRVVSQLSLDRVQVYPDGELNVQAVASSGTSAAFARPVATNRTGGTRVGSGLSSPPTPTAAGRLPPGSPSASLHLPNSSSASSSPLRYSSHAGGATTAAAGSPVPSLKHTTTTLAASGGSGGVARGVGGQFGAVALSPSPPTRVVSAATKRILDALQGLTPGEVDRLEAAVKHEKVAAGR